MLLLFFILQGIYSDESYDYENLFATCSIKPGNRKTAIMPKHECDILITIFHDRDGEIRFNPGNNTPSMGYCYDFKCFKLRVAERFAHKKRQNTKKKIKNPKNERNNKGTTNTTNIETTAKTTKVELDVDEREHRDEHKFDGPKREPIIEKVSQSPIPKREKTPEYAPIIQPAPSFWDNMNQIFNDNKQVAKAKDPDTFVTRYSSQCSLQDRVNQNDCCSPWDSSPCCDYHQRIRRVFGIARFGMGRIPRINLAHKRIVGGTPAGALKTSVVYISKLSFDHQFCGGVIVHPNWVLTAAHCLRDYCGMRGQNDLIIKVGKTSKDNFLYDQGESTLKAIAIHCHQQNCKSDGNPRINDIALVRLNSPIEMSNGVDIAQMPKAFDEPIMSKDCIMLGWGDTKGTGYSDVLKEVRIPLISNEQCNDQRWRSCGVRSCMLCAGKENSSPCSGDSGGPLFCPWHSGLYQLHGVYSYGRCGADRTKPAVFTRVAHYMDWIEDTINKYSDSLA